MRDGNQRIAFYVNYMMTRIPIMYISLTFTVVCSKMYETNWGHMPCAIFLEKGQRRISA